MNPIENFYLVQKENKDNFLKKIRRFVDSGIVKTCDELDRSEKQLHKIGVHPMFGFITAMPIPGVSTTFLATFAFEIHPTRDCPTEMPSKEDFMSELPSEIPAKLNWLLKPKM